jgi:HK97 gp10 family phage protein
MGLFKWNGSQAKDAIDAKVTAMLESMGRAVRDEAVRLCPKKSGHLAASIGYTLRQSDKTVQIHADTHYAFFVEFGTRLMKAQPFLRPALLAARNWGNRGVNTEMQFNQFRAMANPATPAKPAVVKHNASVNRKLGIKFIASPTHRSPTIVYHGNSWVKHSWQGAHKRVLRHANP